MADDTVFKVDEFPTGGNTKTFVTFSPEDLLRAKQGFLYFFRDEIYNIASSFNRLEAESWLNAELQKQKFTSIESSKPLELIEKFVVLDGTHNVMNFTPAQISALIPMIKIFIHKRFLASKDDERWADQPLIFDDYLSSKTVDQITETGRGRGSGVGIKSLDITWRAISHDPKHAQFEADLELFFQSFEDLLGDMPWTSEELDKFGETNKETLPGEMPSIENLEEHTKYVITDYEKKKLRTLSHAEMDRANARFIDLMPGYTLPNIRKQIKVVIGWNVPEDKTDLFGTVVDPVTNNNVELISLIEKLRLIFLFDVVGYDLDVKQDGSLSLSLSLQGGLDRVINSPDADVFQLVDKLGNIEELLSGIIEEVGRDEIDNRWKMVEHYKKVINNSENKLATRQNELDSLSKQGNCEEYVKKRSVHEMNAAELEKVKNTLNYIRIAALPWLLSENAKLFKMRVPYEALEDVTLIEPDVFLTIKRTIPETHLYSGTSYLTAPSSETRLEGKEFDFTFFFLEDFLNIIFTALYSYSDLQNVRVLLGPIILESNIGEPIAIDLTKIPISFDAFIAWWHKKVSGLNMYPVRMVLEDFIKEFLVPIINGNLEVPAEYSFVKITQFSYTDTIPIDPITYATNTLSVPEGVPKTINDERIQSISSKLRSNENDRFVFEYLFIHGITYLGETGFNEDQVEKDIKRGVLHVSIGSERGMLKNVKFSAEDDQNLQAAATLQRKAFVKMYNAELVLYGTPGIFKPTERIFIEPTIMSMGDPSVTRKLIHSQLGLGGYYYISQVNYTIDYSGIFNTTIKAIPVGLASLKQSRANDVKEQENARKCQEAWAEKQSEPTSVEKEEERQENRNRKELASDIIEGATILPPVAVGLEVAEFVGVDREDITQGVADLTGLVGL